MLTGLRSTPGIGDEVVDPSASQLHHGGQWHLGSLKQRLALREEGFEFPETAAAVLKTRASRHEPEVRSYEISKEEIVLGPSLAREPART